MIEINSGIICNIIIKAREINIASDLNMAEGQGDVSDIERKQFLAENRKDDSYLEIKSLLTDLEPDQQEQIIALMYIGRGDFKKNEWRQALEQARTIPFNSRVDYLISKAMLADYLEEGLDIFGYSCEE